MENLTLDQLEQEVIDRLGKRFCEDFTGIDEARKSWYIDLLTELNEEEELEQEKFNNCEGKGN